MNKLDKDIWPNPPNRLYYKKDKDYRMKVSRHPKEDADGIYINWAVLLERLGEVEMPNDVYWNIRKLITEIK